MNRSLVFDLAACGFIEKRDDALFLGRGGTGKSQLAQAIGQAAIQQGHRVLYRETHVLLESVCRFCRNIHGELVYVVGPSLNSDLSGKRAA